MDGAVFELSAKLLDQEPLQKAQKLQKAYRAYTQVLPILYSYDFDGSLVGIIQLFCLI